MGGAVYVTAQWIATHFSGETLVHEVIVVGGVAVVGLAVYGALVTLLRIEEVGLLMALIRRRLGGQG